MSLVAVDEQLERLKREGLQSVDGQLAFLKWLEGMLATDPLHVAEWLLRVRDREGRLVPLRANKVQREFERRAGRKNVVLKARQMGLTTWIAAKFFLQTITTPGTVTVEVAHDMRSAEDLFKIVHRFVENLPRALREGALMTSRANVRELVFPLIESEYRVESAADPNAGRGLTIRNLHCSEVALWPRDAAATLAALRAAVPKDGLVVLESTPKGASGAFYEEWMRAEETGTVRHFFPWWWEESYRSPWEYAEGPNDVEQEWMERHGLDVEQVAYRRQLLSGYRGLAAQEFAEDAETCFLVSGDCLFDVGIVSERLAEVGQSRSHEVAESRSEEELSGVSYQLEGQEGDSAAGENKGLLRRCAPRNDNHNHVPQEDKLLWFYPAVQGREFVVAVDPAGGGADGDDAWVTGVERETGLQCAELRA